MERGVVFPKPPVCVPDGDGDGGGLEVGIAGEYMIDIAGSEGIELREESDVGDLFPVRGGKMLNELRDMHLKTKVLVY